MKKMILFLIILSFNILAQNETEITESLEEACLIAKGINSCLAKEIVVRYNMENTVDVDEENKPIVYACLGMTQSESINSGYDPEGFYIEYPQTKRPEIAY